MAYRHSEALTGVANALSEIAKSTKAKGPAEELKALARQVRELQGYWHKDEDAAELARSGKRVPLKTQYKVLHVGQQYTISADQLEDALAGLAVEGWKVVSSHADMTSHPKWALLLKREVPA